MNSFIFESGPLANRYQGSSRMYKKDKETVDDFFFVVYYVYYTNFKILYELYYTNYRMFSIQLDDI